MCVASHTGFWHVGTISGKLKVDTIIFVWAWSKIAVVFQFTMPHPDVFWYCLNGMGAQKNAPKKFLVTFLYIFHRKTKLNIVYKYLKISIPKCIEQKIFLDTQAQSLRVSCYH